MKKLKQSTTRLFLLSASLQFLVGCAALDVDIPDISPGITLPASGDGYRISTISQKEERIPAAQWEEKKKKGIILFSEDWVKLKTTLLKNCLANDCKQTVEALDGLFYAIDGALRKVVP